MTDLVGVTVPASDVASPAGTPAASDTSAGTTRTADPSGPTAQAEAGPQRAAYVVAGPFDRVVAKQAIAGAAAGAEKQCATWSTPQVAPVAVTFATSGRVTTALITGGSLAGPAGGSCVARALRAAKISPFEGEPVTVRQTLVLP
jgi:hypothetical protein